MQEIASHYLKFSWALERAQTPAVLGPAGHLPLPFGQWKMALRASVASLPPSRSLRDLREALRASFVMNRKILKS